MKKNLYNSIKLLKISRVITVISITLWIVFFTGLILSKMQLDIQPTKNEILNFTNLKWQSWLIVVGMESNFLLITLCVIVTIFIMMKKNWNAAVWVILFAIPFVQCYSLFYFQRQIKLIK